MRTLRKGQTALVQILSEMLRHRPDRATAGQPPATSRTATWSSMRITTSAAPTGNSGKTAGYRSAPNAASTNPPAFRCVGNATPNQPTRRRVGTKPGARTKLPPRQRHPTPSAPMTIMTERRTPRRRTSDTGLNRQDNGVCNYCGHRYPYDQLEMEHMIPRELGGPDHRRNMQLACGACNRKKGTSTDIEFRQLNADLIPPDERTPPRRPVDPERLKSGTQGGRYREEQSARRRAANYRGVRSGNQRRQGR